MRQLLGKKNYLKRLRSITANLTLRIDMLLLKGMATRSLSPDQRENKQHFARYGLQDSPFKPLVGQDCVLWLVTGYLFSVFFPTKRITCAEKRLISARPAEVTRTQNRQKHTRYRNVLSGFGPAQVFTFGLEDSRLTNSTFPDSSYGYLVSFGRIRLSLTNIFCVGS